MSIVKRFIFSLLIAVLAMPLAAQEQLDTAFVFRFMQGSDMFLVPWHDNGPNLNALLGLLATQKQELQEGKRYISVSSYGNKEAKALRTGRIRNLRVKSELITRGGVTEQMFVTDRPFATPYQDSLRNVVVVAFPASVEKVARIVGAEAAARVEAYNKEVHDKAHPQPVEVEQPVAVEEPMQTEPVITEESVQEAAPVVETKAPTNDVSHFALRANLLRWATLTPDLGMEWRINRHVGIAVNGSWTSWTWSNNDRRYALWEVAPEIHYYIGAAKCGYLGAMFKAGEFNYKLSATGRQGDIIGGGIVGGYQLPLSKCLSLDFNLAVGYLHANLDHYTIENKVRIFQSSEKKNWFGPIGAGVTLLWNLF